MTVHDAMVGTAADCDSVLALLQAVALKVPGVMVELLSLQAESRETS